MQNKILYRSGKFYTENGAEIINANDLIKEFDFIDGEAKINPSFKDGDTFPLPSNMRFVIASDGYTGKETKRWATIFTAQPEPEESQHEMFTELLKLFTEFGYKKVLQNFIIQRKKQ